MFTVIDSATGISISRHSTKAEATKRAEFMSKHHKRGFIVEAE